MPSSFLGELRFSSHSRPPPGDTNALRACPWKHWVVCQTSRGAEGWPARNSRTWLLEVLTRVLSRVLSRNVPAARDELGVTALGVSGGRSGQGPASPQGPPGAGLRLTQVSHGPVPPPAGRDEGLAGSPRPLCPAPHPPRRLRRAENSQRFPLAGPLVPAWHSSCPFCLFITIYLSLCPRAAPCARYPGFSLPCPLVSSL